MSMTKTVMELKPITSTHSTRDIWCRVSNYYNNNDFVNPEMEVTYKSNLKVKVPPIFKEFFKPPQGLMKLEMYRATLLDMPRRTLPYPKIFLKHLRHMKPSTYHIK